MLSIAVPVLRVLLMALMAGPGLASAGAPETIERIKPSIAAIGTFQKMRSPAFVFRGTGFVVGDGSLIATNAHVLPDVLDAGKDEVLMIQVDVGAATRQQRRAQTFAIDREHDLALLKLDGPPLPALKLRDSSAIREGDSIAFTGFPIGSVLGLSPVTHRGMVSAITPIVLPSPSARQLDPKVIQRLKGGSFNILQLDATAYPGSSGSPVYDIDSAEVIGVINMVFVKGTKESSLSQPSGITFAVPARFLIELMQDPR